MVFHPLPCVTEASGDEAGPQLSDLKMSQVRELTATASLEIGKVDLRAVMVTAFGQRLYSLTLLV